MRKLITIILIFSFVSTTIFAFPNVTTKDSVNNIISITDTAVKSGKAMLTVFNPGFDETFIASDADSALQYFGTAECSSDGYSFDIEMNVPSDGGTFKAIVTSNGQKEEFDFSFYPYETKLELIRELNLASTSSELAAKDTVDKLLKAYNLNNFDLTPYINKSDLAGILINEKGSGYPLDTDKMYKGLKNSINLVALNSSTGVAFSGNTLKYPELLCDSDPVFLEGYNSVNVQGLIHIKNSLSQKGFDKNLDAQNVFKSKTVLQLFLNNEKLGSGHIADVISDYSSYLTSQGFNLSKLSSIKNKSAFYDYLKALNISELSVLKEKFNSYKEENKQSTQSEGNIGSTSVSSNPGSAQSYVPPVTATVFFDVAENHWAKEPIEKLYSLGIINGKGNSAFDPDGNVTRAEFAKMVVVAIGLTASDEECTFSDVSSHWSKNYVAAAFSNGIVSGMSDDTFSPDSLISREQAATIIYRASLKAGAVFGNASTAFSDNDEINSWAIDAVAALSSKGIINGREGNVFAPGFNLTRAEAAKIIYYSLEILNSK